MRKKKRIPVDPFLPPPYNKMTAAELDAEVAQYDREMPGLPGEPLTGAMKAKWLRFKRKLGRPTIGKGSKRYTSTMERQLLSQLDSYARKHKTTRAAAIASSVRSMLKAG